MWDRRGRSSGSARRFRAALGCLGLILASASSAEAARSQKFSSWLVELRTEALERGISHATVAAALGDVEPVPRVLELDRSQPKKPTEFCDYVRLRLTSTRIERARRMLEEHRALLRQLNAEYGVPPRYLVAVWGLESNFGDYTGDFPVVHSLATLAHDPRRGEIFRGQVFAALRILDERHQVPDAFLGSWAGATGQVQFMPTTFFEYAVDHEV